MTEAAALDVAERAIARALLNDPVIFEMMAQDAHNRVLAARTPQEVHQARRLAEMDATARIRWLRGEISAYAREMAARAYFRLQCWVMDKEIADPKAEILTLVCHLSSKYELGADDARVAFQTEWAAAIKVAEKLGEKLKIIALSHIKATGTTVGLVEAFSVASRSFPDGWPFLTTENLTDIAAGFKPRAKRRG